MHLFFVNAVSTMPYKQGLGRKHKSGTGIRKGRKDGRARVNVAHPKSHSLTPLRPDDEEDEVFAPSAVATSNQCVPAPANTLGTVTPSPHAALPTKKSPPKYNNKVVAFSTIEVAPVNDGKAFHLNKKGET
jgi:hypothetical protein